MEMTRSPSSLRFWKLLRPVLKKGAKVVHTYSSISAQTVKASVFLPRPSFPVTIKPTERSRLDSDLAKNADFGSIYSWQKELTRDEFILLDGPPYANGSLHVGHAVNKILKDFIFKSRIFLGQKVLFQPGWDCHGLPIELAVRRDSKNKEVANIRELAKQYATNVVNEHKSTFKRWGVTADWENPYCTYNPSYVADQLRIFGRIYDKGYIYRDFKPVYWSPSSQSALAESELEYNDQHVSKAVYFAFPVINFDLSSVGVMSWRRREPPLVSSLIWTTTPWTLPLNDAISYNKNLRYALIQFRGNEKEPLEHYYIVCCDRLNDLDAQLGRAFTCIAKFDGNLLDGVFYRSVMYNELALPFLHGDHVTHNVGTGLVHTSFAHGFDDYKIGLSTESKIRSFVDGNGCYTRDVGTKLEGKFVLGEGQETVLNMFKKYVLHEENITHSYPYDWRSHKPVIIRSTRQWFIDVSEIGTKCVDRLKNDKITLQAGNHGTEDFSATMSSFLMGRPDWCISRQRAWGVPIPALLDRTGTKHYTSVEFINLVADRMHSDYNWYWNAHVGQLSELLKDYDICPYDVVKSTDIMDVWFDSGLAWLTLDGKTADVILEGRDQFRGWFSSLLLTAMISEDRIPFKRVLVHGFTVDESSKKMSKSKGNVINPMTITDGSLKTAAIGADGLRLWVALYGSENPGDIRIGDSVLEDVKLRLKQARLSFRFILGVLERYEGQVPQQLHFLDQFILRETHYLDTRIRSMYENYEFRHATNNILQFLRSPLSSTYINLVKDRLYCDKVQSPSHISAQYTFNVIGNTLMGLLAPITPHLATEYCSHHPLLKNDISESYRNFLTMRREDNCFDVNLDKILNLTQTLRRTISNEEPAKRNYILKLGKEDRQLIEVIKNEVSSTTSQLVELLGVGSVDIEDSEITELIEVKTNLDVCKRCRKRNVQDENQFCSRCSDALGIV